VAQLKMNPELKIVVLYKRNAEPDAYVLELIERSLAAKGFPVFIDRHLQIGVQWAREIEHRIRAADAVIVLLSDAALGSEMLQYELESVADERRKRGTPVVLPVRLGSDTPIEGPMAALVNEFHYLLWAGPQDDQHVVDELVAAVTSATPAAPKEPALEPAGGAVPMNSPFYLARDTDAEFEDAIQARESVILVRGPRQIGKTSLLGRGTRLVKELGWRQVSTDFQMVSSAQLCDADRFARMLAATLAKQLNFQYDFEGEWLDVFGPNMNLANFVRALVAESDQPLVWFMDEADRLFAAPFASDFFGLVRSWHNARATEPEGPWGRFTLVISYATEARLFIQDLNQSPFNVGRQIGLKSFTLDQTVELNERYGNPIKRRSDLEALHFLLSGHPFLTRRALDQVASGAMTFHTLIETADRDDGPFGDHLKRILVAVSQVPEVMAAVQTSLDSLPMADSDAMHRLVAAGILREVYGNRATIACDLYAQYLGRYLG